MKPLWTLISAKDYTARHMRKVYIAALEKNSPTHLPLLNAQFGVRDKPSRLFHNEAAKYLFRDPVVDIVDSPQTAEFILIPYDYFSISENDSYIKKIHAMSEAYGKKLVVFDFSDFDRSIQISHAHIFRTSVYRSRKLHNEIVIPPLVGKLTRGPAKIRHKEKNPIVGFCGWAAFSSAHLSLKHHIKNGVWNIRHVFGYPEAKAHKQGIYFRRKATRIIKKTKYIETNFIIRKSYSGHQNTIEISPEKARMEYITNMINSDLLLAPKGDGNFSARFYEALSIGRIPLLIDTDMILPAENVIDYQNLICRVRYDELHLLPDKIQQWWESLTEHDYMERQQQAWKIFDTQLRLDQFLRTTFEQL